MKKLSAPTDNELYADFVRVVPYGVRATLIRALVRIALLPENKDVMWAIVGSENEPQRFTLTDKNSNGMSTK